VPKDVIERAINKAIGGDAENYDEIRYEGYGPNGVAVIVEAMTDNRNRTASTVRSTFGKHGGNLGETGSVAFMFERKGAGELPGGCGRCRHGDDGRDRGGRRRRGKWRGRHMSSGARIPISTRSRRRWRRTWERASTKLVWRPTMTTELG
jgi:hypothetical protein